MTSREVMGGEARERERERERGEKKEESKVYLVYCVVHKFPLNYNNNNNINSSFFENRKNYKIIVLCSKRYTYSIVV